VEPVHIEEAEGEFGLGEEIREVVDLPTPYEPLRKIPNSRLAMTRSIVVIRPSEVGEPGG
jgi:hypothetical protein